MVDAVEVIEGDVAEEAREADEVDPGESGPSIDGIETTHLRLVETTPFASGIVVNTYAPTR